jgi:hypothetical protein
MGESLRSICAGDDMPSAAVVFKWLASDKHPEFVEQYTRAREMQADTLFDDLLEIADDGSNDWMKRNAEENPGWVANGEHIQRSRLRIDARKWMASKLRPKKYGEKLELAGDPDNPVVPAASSTDVAKALLAVLAKKD